MAISLPSGCIGLHEPHVEIKPGDRVLVAAELGAGKTSLFRTLAGLWRWGKGTISLPPGDGIMFMPKRPCIPRGTLRDILAYPASPAQFKEQDVIAAMTRMRLPHLCRELDRAARWNQELADPEQQGLAFARLLLHNPRWVFIDEALNSLAPAAEKAFLQAFRWELADTTLIYINGPEAEDKFYTRVLRLTKKAEGRALAVQGGQKA